MGWQDERFERPEGPADTSRFRLLPDVASEEFGDTVVLFLVEQERFVTVNQAAADLVQTVRNALGERYVDVDGLADTLEAAYALSADDARDAARSLADEWLECGLFEREE